VIFGKKLNGQKSLLKRIETLTTHNEPRKLGESAMPLHMLEQEELSLRFLRLTVVCDDNSV